MPSSSRTNLLTRPAGAAAPAGDGRHARSQSSRARIVAAMLELVGQGDVQPSAARVAETAGVGLRTVFRHFDDMEALYRELSEAIEARVLPILLKPFVAPEWRGRIREMAERRTELFEAILPFRISASLKRFQSSFLMRDYRRMLRLERETIDMVLPPEILADPVRANMVYCALNFQSWRSLRHDMELEVAVARAVFLATVDAVLAAIPEG
ncbi:TetR/AcrR family transcriptional regulator [Sphingomonas sp. GlSt437]|uniref:TetR/AcrR family transcriptional regulator n=1 Tax=Sphingomonas sp. GlSt437 TaxID=3389970 RepID=UPI003A87C191